MAAAATSAGLRSARPVIAVGGQDNSSLSEGLSALLVVETAAGLYRAEATFGNWGPVNNSIGFLYFDRQLLDFGKSFQVKLGPDVIFDARITGLEARFPKAGEAREITVLAEDRFQDLRMTRRTRTFADMSDSDIIHQIATDQGLTPSVDVTGPTHKVIAQVNQSDLAFLRGRARAIDAELWMEGRTLHAQARSRRNRGRVVLGYGNELTEFTALADLAGQRTAASVNGWDVAGKQAVQYEAAEAAIASELDNGDSGASILQAKFGARKEALAHTVPLSHDEAQARAEAFFRAGARRFVSGRGLAQPETKLRVGHYVDLQGLGPLFSGKYYLSEVRYLLDGCGLRIEFAAERPGLGRP